MKRFFDILKILVCVFALLSLAGCGVSTPQETTAPTEDPNLLVTEFTLAAQDEDDLLVLEDYPNLVSADLRGSTCYDAILSYIADNPQVHVIYDVAIGEGFYDPALEMLLLEDGSFDFRELLDRIPYFPKLKEIQLPETTLSVEDLRELCDSFPEIGLKYTVSFLDGTIAGDTTELDLSALGSEETEPICAALSRLINLTDVRLTDDEGKSNFEIGDVKAIMDALPGVNVHYSFQLFGKTLTTMDERVEYVKSNIGDEGVEKIRQALDIMPNCTYLLMDRCGVHNEVMAQLRDDYPDRKIVWRIYFADYSCLTDVTVFRCVEQLHDGNSKQLKYCTDVVYLDIGHSYNLADLSFVSYMPNLKVAIVADCYTKTLEPFAACKNLQWIEIVNCVRLKDLSPLANCTNLRGVNMSYTFGIDDLSPLYGLEHLERLFLGRHDLPQETVDEAKAALPNCWVTDESWDVAWIGFNYSIGWRLDDEHTFADWYLEIKEVFGYDRGI